MGRGNQGTFDTLWGRGKPQGDFDQEMELAGFCLGNMGRNIEVCQFREWAEEVGPAK